MNKLEEGILQTLKRIDLNEMLGIVKFKNVKEAPKVKNIQENLYRTVLTVLKFIADICIITF